MDKKTKTLIFSFILSIFILNLRLTSSLNYEIEAKENDVIVYRVRDYDPEKENWNDWTYLKYNITNISDEDQTTNIYANYWKPQQNSTFKKSLDVDNILITQIGDSNWTGDIILPKNKKITDYEESIKNSRESLYSVDESKIMFEKVSQSCGYKLEIKNETTTIYKEELIFATEGVLLYKYQDSKLSSDNTISKKEMEIVPYHSTIDGAEDDIMKPKAEIGGYIGIGLFSIGTIVGIFTKKRWEMVN